MISTHEIYLPLYEDKDSFIYIITGGRGSGKSYAISNFVERLTFEMTKEGITHQILYTRYTMASAHISIIPEMTEKIELDGTSKYFSSTKSDVINKMTGSHIMFRGIKTSSGNQTAKLKSIHGITTFVVDEGEEWTSEQDFEKIMLSIRQKGIRNRIIIIMNPTDNNHWVYKRFFENTHRIEYFDGVPVQISTYPNVLHIHTTYLDNIENLSPEFLKEVQDIKNNNPEKYAHTVIGQWSDVAEGAIFKTIYECDSFPEWVDHVAIGIDFGYATDPSCGVLCGVRGNDIYLHELFYRPGMLSKTIAQELKKYNLPVMSESADPRLIDEILLQGVNIYPVEKGPGSVVAGIDFLQGYNIHITRSSTNGLREGRNYVWAKDKNGYYINVPEDHDNHFWDAVRYYCTGKLLGHVKVKQNLSTFNH